MGRPTGTTRVKKPILKKEYDRLIRAVNYNTDMKSVTKTKMICAFTLLYLTGCRVSEITRLTRDDLDSMICENEYSLTNSTKTKTPRLISFDEGKAQIEFLKKLAPAKKCIFYRNNSESPMTVSALTLLLNRFIHTILGQLYSTHSFRAGYVTAFHQQGMSLEHIRQDIGHASIATTARYATVTSQEISLGKNTIKW